MLDNLLWRHKNFWTFGYFRRCLHTFFSTSLASYVRKHLMNYMFYWFFVLKLNLVLELLTWCVIIFDANCSCKMIFCKTAHCWSWKSNFKTFSFLYIGITSYRYLKCVHRRSGIKGKRSSWCCIVSSLCSYIDCSKG